MRIILRLFGFALLATLLLTSAAIFGARLPNDSGACVNYSIGNRPYLVDIARGRTEPETRGTGRFWLNFGTQGAGSLFLEAEDDMRRMNALSTRYRLILQNGEGETRTLMTGIPGAQNLMSFQNNRALFSPSGDRAVFYWMDESEGHLSLIDIAAGSVQTLPIELPERARPESLMIAGWSGDERYIALSLRPATQLRFLFLDTETMTVLPFGIPPAEYATGREALANGLEVWSPDGHTFAAIQYPPNGREQTDPGSWLTLFTPGAPEPLITVPLPFPLDSAEIIHWSPNGEALVVGWKESTCWRDRCITGWHFALIDRDGSVIMPDLQGLRLDLRAFSNRAARVSSDNEPLPGTWSPDGREWIFFNAYAGDPVNGDTLDYRLDLVAFDLQMRTARTLAHDVEPGWATDMQTPSWENGFSSFDAHATSRDPRLLVMRAADERDGNEAHVAGYTAEIIDLRDERRTPLIENVAAFNDLVTLNNLTLGSEVWSGDGRYLTLAYQSAPDANTNTSASRGVLFARSNLEATSIIARIDGFDSIRSAQIISGYSFNDLVFPGYAYVIGTRAGITSVEMVNLDTGEQRRLFEDIPALAELVQATVTLTYGSEVLLHINGTGVDTPRAVFRQDWNAPTYETLIASEVEQFHFTPDGDRFAYFTPVRMGRFELRVIDAAGAHQAHFPLQSSDYQWLGSLSNCAGIW